MMWTKFKMQNFAMTEGEYSYMYIGVAELRMSEALFCLVFIVHFFVTEEKVCGGGVELEKSVRYCL